MTDADFIRRGQLLFVQHGPAWLKTADHIRTAEVKPQKRTKYADQQRGHAHAKGYAQRNTEEHVVRHIDRMERLGTSYRIPGNWGVPNTYVGQPPLDIEDLTFAPDKD